MDYNKWMYLEKLHALIGFVWNGNSHGDWDDSQERKNAIDFYACVLYDVAHRTPPKEEDYRDLGAQPMGFRLARSLFQGWSSGPLKGAIETFCLLVNYFFIRRIPGENRGKEGPIPDMGDFKEDVLLSLFGLSKPSGQESTNCERKRIL